MSLVGFCKIFNILQTFLIVAVQFIFCQAYSKEGWTSREDAGWQVEIGACWFNWLLTVLGFCFPLLLLPGSAFQSPSKPVVCSVITFIPLTKKIYIPWKQEIFCSLLLPCGLNICTKEIFVELIHYKESWILIRNDAKLHRKTGI